MKHSFSVRVLLFSGLAAFFATGCSTVPLDKEGDMQATYVAGEFRMVVNADATRTVNAATQAFKQLGLFEVRRELKTFSAELAARTPADEKVRVSIKEINSRQTELGIRVDVAGDKILSRKIYDRIEANLGGAQARASGGW